MTQKAECTLDYMVLAQLQDVDMQNGDPYLLQDLIGLFIKSTPGRLAQMTDALVRKDFAGMKQVAHTLKTSCGYLGAVNLRALCLALESACHETNFALAQIIVKQMAVEYPKLEAALKTAPVELARYRKGGVH